MVYYHLSIPPCHNTSFFILPWNTATYHTMILHHDRWPTPLLEELTQSMKQCLIVAEGSRSSDLSSWWSTRCFAPICFDSSPSISYLSSDSLKVQPHKSRFKGSHGVFRGVSGSTSPNQSIPKSLNMHKMWQKSMEIRKIQNRMQKTQSSLSHIDPYDERIVSTGLDFEKFPLVLGVFYAV